MDSIPKLPQEEEERLIAANVAALERRILSLIEGWEKDAKRKRLEVVK